MDPTEVLEKTYNLFLISEIIENESDIDKELERLLIDRDYDNMAKTMIYILIYTLNNELAYRNIRQIYINDAIDLLYIIDRVGFNDEKIMKKFVNLLYQFYSYSLQYKIKFIADKEKRELVKAKLNELVHMAQWEQ
jgi:transcription termination factor NusB